MTQAMRLRPKLVLLSVGVTLLSLLALSGAVGLLLWRAEVAALTQAVSGQADALLDLAVRTPGPLPAGAEALLYREGAASSARAFEDGRPVWTGGTPDPALLALPPAPTAAVDRPLRHRDLIVAVRRSGRDAVQVGRSLTPIRRTLERYGLVALGAGAGLAALAGLVTAWVVGATLRPLERLAARVRRLGDPLPVPGVLARGEVGDLARALDLSLAELRDQREREALFLANASHELRTPVAALIADVQHARSRPRSPQELAAALARTERTALRLRELTGNLLSLTRARQAPSYTPTDLLALAGDVVDRLHPLAAERGLDLLLDGEPAQARVDPDLVTRALENLVGNALKFTPRGEVRVSVHALGAYAELRVEDSGPGMPEGVETLFEPFARGPARQEGSGLGLTVVREVAQAHGGRVRLERRSQGGTRARLVLPGEPPPSP
ncbi:signal transduction histidine kinase [Deinococcus budaensis]|uniref:histidine kinase n=1 Tax=Deinococcus budaensis TaxID=1665626 RepID=A0A7W8GFM7_9DEIO|nr:signal transduction histidine kinase [Deinococcus budaensis]